MTLWRKSSLSTINCAFTITTSLYTNLFTTTTKPLARMHPGRYQSAQPSTSTGHLRAPAGQYGRPGSTPVVPTRLWKSRGISTGSDVQNTANPASHKNCPSFVQTSHKPCSAGKRVRKPLMLWSKPELSTEEAAFTIYYQFYIHTLVN